MRDQLAVRFEYSPVEHVRALDETPYRRLVAKWWVPGSIAFLAVPFASVAIRRDLFAGPLNRLLWLGAFGLLPMLAFMLALPTVMRRFEIARHRRARTEHSAAIETREFGREGYTRGEGSRLIPWPMISRVVESDSFYLFYHAWSEIPDYLPKRALTSADADVLRALLHDQFQARTNDLQLLSRAT